ncbi:MAG: hypothetical protein Greene041619_600 [Candidatus Peregrinibacteria bacterium Greene0416_19]|nr:MAG: hypothetical protein Greene041619_600 [Candidatus Peregrinibacteria bacterium Greene0416_19]
MVVAVTAMVLVTLFPLAIYLSRPAVTYKSARTDKRQEDLSSVMQEFEERDEVYDLMHEGKWPAVFDAVSDDRLVLAWMLAICADDQFRDPKRALDIATAEGDAERPWRLQVIAAAHASLGNYDEAVVQQGAAVTMFAGSRRLQRLNSLYLSGQREAEDRLALYKQRKPYREPYRKR